MIYFILGLVIPISLYFLFLKFRKFAQGGKCPKEYLRNVKNQTFVVTGGNSGIGFETVKNGAKKVIIASRNKTKILKAMEDLKKFCQNSEQLSYLIVDLSSVKSIDKFVSELTEKVDVFLMNAGVALYQREVSVDGVELTFSTNHMGNFYISQKMFQKWCDDKTRVVVVGSGAHLFVKNFEPKMEEIFSPRKELSSVMDSLKLYGFAKFCNVLFAIGLNKRFENNSGSLAVSLHPGAIPTNIGKYGKSSFKVNVILALSDFMMKIFGKTPANGAQTSLFCCCAPEKELTGGEYYSDCQLGKKSSLITNENSEKLWKFSEEVLERIMCEK